MTKKRMTPRQMFESRELHLQAEALRVLLVDAALAWLRCGRHDKWSALQLLHESCKALDTVLKKMEKAS